MKRIIAFILFVAPFVQADTALTRSQRIVALTILGEARGEGKAGMYAVACVIQQRSKNRKITPAQVCLQKRQFSCWNDGKESHSLKTPQGIYAKFLAINLLATTISFHV